MILFNKKIKPVEKIDYKYYLSIDSLPFWNYEKIYSTNDHRYLLMLDYYDILPEVKVDENYYKNINREIFIVSNPKKAESYIRDYLYIDNLVTQYRKLDDATFILCKPDFISDTLKNDMIYIVENIIKKYIADYTFKRSTEIEYFNSIVFADNQKKGINTKIGMKNDEFEHKYYPKNKNGEVKKADLYKSFGAIQQYFKVDYNPKIMTTRQFFERNATMIELIKAQKN